MITTHQDVLNKMLQHPEIRNLFASLTPHYRFWHNKRGDRYFYTTEKVNHKGNARYVAGIYRYLKTKKQWKMVKRVGFAKKKGAIAWAYNAYKNNL